MRKFGQLLQQKRKVAQLSISELAALSDLPESHLAAMEEGVGETPSFDTCHRVGQTISRRIEQMHFEPRIPDPAMDASVIERFYLTRFQEIQQAAETERRDQLLVQAQEDRELAAVQMDEDWLGMKLLACLRESPGLRTTELADKLGEPIDAVAPILARLVRFGAIEVRHRQFVCTEKGSNLLRNLETATGISLAP